jgi:hypothetical protein
MSVDEIERCRKGKASMSDVRRQGNADSWARVLDFSVEMGDDEIVELALRRGQERSTLRGETPMTMSDAFLAMCRRGDFKYFTTSLVLTTNQLEQGLVMTAQCGRHQMFLSIYQKLCDLNKTNQTKFLKPSVAGALRGFLTARRNSGHIQALVPDLMNDIVLEEGNIAFLKNDLICRNLTVFAGATLYTNGHIIRASHQTIVLGFIIQRPIGPNDQFWSQNSVYSLGEHCFHQGTMYISLQDENKENPPDLSPWIWLRCNKNINHERRAADVPRFLPHGEQFQYVKIIMRCIAAGQSAFGANLKWDQHAQLLLQIATSFGTQHLSAFSPQSNAITTYHKYHQTINSLINNKHITLITITYLAPHHQL